MKKLIWKIDPQFRVGMLFNSVEGFRKAIRAHVVKHRRKIRFGPNNKRKVRVKCQQNCEWECYASKYKGQQEFQI